MTSPGPQRGSAIRYVAGLMCLLLAMVTLPIGFVQIVRTLNRGGYGTSSITLGLMILGLGGGFLGFGIALLIWELSVRHNIRH